MLHGFDKEEFERVVFILFGAFELKFLRKLLAEVRAKLGICAGVFWLLPSLLYDLFDEHLAYGFTFEQIFGEIQLYRLQVLRYN